MKTIIKIFTLMVFAVSLLFLTTESTAQTDKKNRNKKTVYYGVLPNGYKIIKFNKSKVYTYNGKYYQKEKRGYRVISPPVGLRINKLPSGAKKVIVSYQSYYVKNNIYYKYNLRTNTYIVVKCPI